jgi:autotransporter-associated beta strand protein
LVKTTAGVATLTSANTYTGGTSITGGTLLVNNAAGSGTGTGDVSVSDGGLLAGTGSISGIVTNGPGGTISAGDVVGVLNLGSSFWFGGSTNRWDISNATGTAGTGWDLLNLSGSLTINATTNNKAYIDITSFTLGGLPGLASNFNPTNSYLWTILTASGGINFAPGENEQTVLELLAGNFINPQTGGRFGIFVSSDGRNLNLTFTPFVPVPEPGTFAIAVLAVCGIIYGRRMKQNWGSSGR